MCWSRFCHQPKPPSGRFAVELVGKFHRPIIGLFAGNGGAFSHSQALRRIIFAVEFKIGFSLVDRALYRVAVLVPHCYLNGVGRADLYFGALPSSDETGGAGSALEFCLIVGGRSVGSPLGADVSGGCAVFRNRPHGVAGRFAISFRNPMPGVRSALRHRPGIPILGRVRFAIDSNGLGVVAKDELVLVAAGFFDFVSEAIELALVGIKLPLRWRALRPDL